MFEPALRRPFKVLGKCKKASCEVRQGKCPVLAEFGNELDLYGRVERKNGNADGGTCVLPGVTEDAAQPFAVPGHPPVGPICRSREGARERGDRRAGRQQSRQLRDGPAT